MKTKSIIKGKLGQDISKLYVFVDPYKSSVILERLILTSNIEIFKDCEVRRVFKGKYLLRQRMGLDFEVFSYVITSVDRSIEIFEENLLKNLK